MSSAADPNPPAEAIYGPPAAAGTRARRRPAGADLDAAAEAVDCPPAAAAAPRRLVGPLGVLGAGRGEVGFWRFKFGRTGDAFKVHGAQLIENGCGLTALRQADERGGASRGEEGAQENPSVHGRLLGKACQRTGQRRV